MVGNEVQVVQVGWASPTTRFSNKHNSCVGCVRRSMIEIINTFIYILRRNAPAQILK